MRSFFNTVRPGIEAAIKNAAPRPIVADGQEAFADDVAVDPEDESASTERASHEEEERAKREEATKKRRSQSGWDDGRSRH